jgi:TPR repeat protein
VDKEATTGMRYFNFDLLIEQASDGYVARVLESPAGQARSTFRPPFTPMEAENLILKIGRSRRGNRSFDAIPTKAAKELGGRMFESVFSQEVRMCLQSSLYSAESQQAGLRIRLRLDAPDLADLPWEYLYNASLNSFLALSAETSLVRYLELARPMRPPLLSPPLKVLSVIASPTDYPRLAGEDEWRNLNTALEPLRAAGQVHLERLKPPTLTALQTHLRRGSYHVLHFVGHGGFDERAQDGVLILEDDHGRGSQVTSHRLATILHNHPSLQLAVLNCCDGARLSVSEPFSGVAQSLIQQGVPAVIAMQFEISDDAAITFGRVFYESLADGLAVDAALVEARTGMYSTRDDVEFGAPVLYMRSPDGVLFNLARPTQAASEAAVPHPAGESGNHETKARPVEVPLPPAPEIKTAKPPDPAPDPPQAPATLYAATRAEDRTTQGLGKKKIALLGLAALAVAIVIGLTARQGLDRGTPPEPAHTDPVQLEQKQPDEADLKQVLALYTGEAGHKDDKKARHLVESAVAKGDELATMLRARSIYFGQMGYPKDQPMAQRIASTVVATVEIRAKSGDMLAAFLWGSALSEGIAVDQNAKLATTWLEKACNGGKLLIACNELGVIYNNGEGVTKDQGKAVELYRTACNGGLLKGCANLGAMYQNGQEITQNSGKAAELYRTACDGGEPLGCFYLGFLYESGQGVTQDLGKAVELYRLACDGGVKAGCSYLGDMYESGKGVTQDLGKAAELFRAACDGGDAGSCSALGFMYAIGKGVAQDLTKAVELYRTACDGGYQIGCFNLGTRYESGQGVAQDLSKAVELYRTACDSEEPNGCFGLGNLYSRGKGVTADTAKAQELYRRACKGGVADACKKVVQ